MTLRQKRIFWPSVSAVILAATAIVFTSPRHQRFVAPAQPKLTQQSNQAEFKQRIRVFVHDNDIRPKVIHAWPGTVVVSVENEAQGDVSLRIERVLVNLTEPVGAINLAAGSKRGQQEIVLVAGEYMLFEASRPSILTQLIVEPRN